MDGIYDNQCPKQNRYGFLEKLKIDLTKKQKCHSVFKPFIHFKIIMPHGGMSLNEYGKQHVNTKNKGNENIEFFERNCLFLNNEEKKKGQTYIQDMNGWKGITYIHCWKTKRSNDNK